MYLELCVIAFAPRRRRCIAAAQLDYVCVVHCDGFALSKAVSESEFDGELVRPRR